MLEDKTMPAWSYPRLTDIGKKKKAKGLLYSSFQVGCPKIPTRIRACAHFGGDLELKILRMRGFSSRFLDNQPENCCTLWACLWAVKLGICGQVGNLLGRLEPSIAAALLKPFVASSATPRPLSAIASLWLSGIAN